MLCWLEISMRYPHSSHRICWPLFGAAEINRFLLSRDGDRSERLSADGQTIKSLANFVRRNDCREILLALPWNDTDRIDFVREQIKALPVACDCCRTRGSEI